MKEHRLTEEDFLAFQALGFPTALGWVSDRHGRGQESVYSREQIGQWRAKLLAVAAKLK